MNDFKSYLINYLHNFTIYDYFGYIFVLVIFGAIIVFAILISRRNILLFSAIVLFDILLLFLMFVGVKVGLDRLIREVKVVEVKSTYLPFSKNLVVVGKVVNKAKVKLNRCRFYLLVFKKGKDKKEEIFNKIHPYALVYKDLAPNITKIKFVIPNFSYKDYKVEIKANCY